jgi:hypothetical protein
LRDLKITNTTAAGNSATLFVNPNGALAERVVVETSSSATNQTACSVLDGTMRDSSCRLTVTGTGAGVALNATTNIAGSYTADLINVTVWARNPGGGLVTGLLGRATASGVNVTVLARNLIAHGAGSIDASAATSVAGATATVTLTNSNFATTFATGAGSSVSAPGSPTNQTTPPMLIDPDNDDFRQLTGSMTINAGAVDLLLGTLDLEFQARNQGGAPDIGADEFNIPATPVITDTDPDSPAADNAPEVKGTAVAGSTVKIYSTLDCSGAPLASGSAAQFASPGITTPVPSDTTTNLRATASDALNHNSGCSGAFPYTESPTPPAPPADSVRPETRIDSGPKATVKTKKKKVKVSIAFSANETASFRCSLDRAAPAPCSSPFSATVKKGTHTFEVTATDSAGNADPTPATTTWKVKRKKKKH